jgi:hypothetical protein
MHFQNSYAGIAVIARAKLSGLGEHWGVLLPNGLVAHNTDDKGPHYMTLQEFHGGKPVKVIRDVPQSEYHATHNRIQQELSQPMGYDLLTNNCEIFANRVTGYMPESPQVKGWAFFLGIVGLAILATRAA